VISPQNDPQEDPGQPAPQSRPAPAGDQGEACTELVALPSPRPGGWLVRGSHLERCLRRRRQDLLV